MSKSTFNKNIKIIAFFVIFLLLGCHVDKIDDTEVDPDEIWGLYMASYDATLRSQELIAAFRQKNRHGPPIRLTGNANIKVDGEELTKVEERGLPFTDDDVYYLSQKSDVDMKESFSFAWTKNNGGQVVHLLEQPSPREIVSPITESMINLNQELTIKLDAPLRPDDVGIVTLQVDTEWEQVILEVPVQGDEVTISPFDLMYFQEGQRLSVNVKTIKSEESFTGHPKGARLISRYESQTLFYILTASD